MARVNVEVAKQAIEAFKRRDVDVIFKCVNSEVERFDEARTAAERLAESRV